MKGYKIIKNILQVIVLVACFAMQCNAQLPPPFDMPGKMFEIFTRNLAGEASQEEEKQNLYDGIRFARRQQCLEIPDVKDISEVDNALINENLTGKVTKYYICYPR